jgi:predicted nucleotidyltransferase
LKPSPVEILFGMYRRKILALLLMRHDERFHVREIARLTAIPAGSLHRELKLLAEAELLIRSRSGNQVYYQANRDCQIFPELAGLFRKTLGLADVIRAALLPMQASIDIAFVFGSVAQGTARTGSDIDLFIIGDATFTDVVGALADTHQQLGRDINPVIMSGDEFREKASGDPFVSRVMEETKIFIMGGGDDLGKLAANRAAEGTQDHR